MINIPGLRGKAHRYQVISDLQGSLELGLLFLGGLHFAGASTSLRTGIVPYKFVTPPHDTGIEPIDVFATWGILGWQGLKD